MEMLFDLLNSCFCENQLSPVEILDCKCLRYFLLCKNLFLIHLEDNILLRLVLVIFTEF